MIFEDFPGQDLPIPFIRGDTSRATLAHMIVALLCAGGCTSQPNRPVATPAMVDSAHIILQVRAGVEAFLAADTTKNAEAVIDLLWPDYTMLVDGSRLGYDDAAAGSRAFMSTLDLFHTEWTDIQIVPLGANAAVASFMFRDSILTKTGELIRSRGTTTFVWQQRDGEWRILFADADHAPIEP